MFSKTVPDTAERRVCYSHFLAAYLMSRYASNSFCDVARIFHASNDSEFCNDFLRVHRYAKERDFLHAKESV